MYNSPMNIKLLALDMDDTLLGEDLKISPRNLEALKEAERRGIRVVLASGRAPQAMTPFIAQLGMDKLEGYLIAFNGALVQRTDTAKVEFRSPLDTQIGRGIWKECEEQGWALQTYRGGEIFVNRLNEYTGLDTQLTGIPHRVVGEEEFFSEDPIKLIIPGEPEALAFFAQKIRDKWKGQANMFRSKPYFFEILSLSADKGLALEQLAKRHGFGAHQVMAMGDALNDHGMLSWAGFPVAVANALPEIKALAKVVTVADHNGDAVAEALYRYCFD